MIIAGVPVPPAVYRQLRSQAEAAGQTPSQLMASILAAAAGRQRFEPEERGDALAAAGTDGTEKAKEA
jgi:hypothetical protein